MAAAAVCGGLVETAGDAVGLAGLAHVVVERRIVEVGCQAPRIEAGIRGERKDLTPQLVPITGFQGEPHGLRAVAPRTTHVVVASDVDGGRPPDQAAARTACAVDRAATSSGS